MQVMQQSLFDSQVHVIQVRKYCTKYETFLFPLPADSLFSRKMKAGPDLGLVWDELYGRYECKQGLEIHVN